MNIGDVYLVRLPNIDGYEQMGQRPVIIVQKPEYNLKLPTILIVPLTSKLSALNYKLNKLYKLNC